MSPARAPACSVCIANYNGRETLEACLRSVLAQDCPFEVEIIVHDDASTDGAIEGLQERYPQVELLQSSDNVGFCVSNNRMVDIARGRFVLLLNNDAELLPDALRRLHERALELPAAILGLPQFALPGGQLLDRGSRLDPFLNPVPNLDARRTRVGMVMGACLWLPRDLWHELGGFPEWFHTLAEDLYLCCRARLAGYAVEVLPESGFRHHVGHSLGGGKVVERRLRTTRRRRALSERNKTFVMIVCYPTPAALFLIPLHLVLLVLEGLALSVAKRDASLWKDIYAFCLQQIWSHRRRLLRERSLLQKMRHTSLKHFFAVFVWVPHKLSLLRQHGVPDIR